MSSVGDCIRISVFIINRGGEAIDWMGYLRHSESPLLFIVFYLNTSCLYPIFIQWTHPRIYVAQPRVDHTYEWRSSSMAKRPFGNTPPKAPVSLPLVGFSLFGICSQWYLPSDCPQHQNEYSLGTSRRCPS